MSIVLAAVLRIVLVRANKRLDRGEAVEAVVSGVVDASEGQVVRKGFRYLV